MRLFFAIPIPQEISRKASEGIREKVENDSSLRWVPSENQHFTLYFLGEVKEERLKSIRDAGQAVASKHPPFTIQVLGTGFFPDQERPRIFWAGVEKGKEELKTLAASLSLALKEVGFFHQDAHPFVPHLTLARIKGRIPLRVKEALKLFQDRDFGSFFVDRFLLMESKLFPERAIYYPRETFLLKV